MKNKKYKITLVTSVGTYETHLAWTVASAYNLVDEVIITNGGIYVDDPFGKDDIILQREVNQIKELDIDNKCLMIKASWKGLDISKEENEFGRGRNLTQSARIAREQGADWIIKTDADELIDSSVTRERLEHYISISNNGQLGYRFGMWEIHGKDYAHYQSLPSWASEDDQNYPSSNDSIQFFKPNKGDFFYGGGAPVVKSSINPQQDLNCWHVRYCVPPDLEPYKYFYERFLYHLFAPEYLIKGKDTDIDKIKKEAHDKALSHVESMVNNTDKLHKVDPNNKDARVPPRKPLVMELGFVDYIKYMKEKL